MKRRRGRAASQAFLACLMLAAALSACGHPAGSHAGAAAPPQPLRAAEPTGPFDGLTVEPASVSARLQAADDQLTADCMKQRSFGYHVAAPPVPLDAEATTGVYDLISAPVAAAQGYGIADNALSRQAADAIGATVDAAAGQPAYLAALTGTAQHQVTLKLIGGSTVSYDADGCVTTALTKLYGADWNQVSFDLEGLSAQIEQAVRTSPAWTGAIARWSSCMSTRYRVKYADPQAARGDVSSVATAAIKDVSPAVAAERLKSVRAGEVRLAQQDAACQQAVGLSAVAQTVQNQAQASDEQRYDAELKAYAADFTHAEAVAAELPRS